MREMPGDLDFTPESFGAEGRRQVFVQDLDGDVTVLLEVTGEIDGGHSAASDLPRDAVAGRELRSQLILIHVMRLEMMRGAKYKDFGIEW